MAAPRVLIVALALGLSSTAYAQTDESIELQLFDPAVGPASFLTVSGAETMARRQFQVGLSLTYMTGALRVYNVENMDTLESTRSDVVKSILAGQLSGAYGLRDDLHLGVALPMIFSLQGDGLVEETGTPKNGGLSVTGLGDARLEATWRFYDKNGLQLAAIPAVTLPTSTSFGADDGYLGDDLPSFRPKAAAVWTSVTGAFDVGANLGVILRKPRTYYSSEVGQQLTYGLAATWHVNRRVDVIGEGFGRKGFQTDLDASPLEVDAAVRFEVMPAISVQVGGGAGVIRGIGAPGLRLFAAATWSPDYRDSDGDGVPNQSDRCPMQAEDKDGYRDGDGCADDDNDEDLINDDQDKCPAQPEDKDGWDDDDGCPEEDNDKDGFLDAKDQCPNLAEDKLPPFNDDGCPAGSKDTDADDVNDAVDKCFDEQEDKDGFEDEDGCPEADNDKDNVLDEADGCPNAAEDVDNWRDEDGCPDMDNDLDGFWDLEDNCPFERETVNGVKDGDGCPDRGGKVLAKYADPKVEVSKLTFEGNRVKSVSHPILDQAAYVMRGQPGVLKWRVVVAEKGDLAKAQKRADAVKAHLVTKGLAAERIEAVGAAGDPTFAIVALEKDPKIVVPESTEPEIEITPEGEPELEMEIQPE